LSDLNPYLSPILPAEPIPSVLVRPASNTIALLFLLGSVAAALTYTYLDEVVIQSKHGAWPMLIGVSAVSVVSAFLTRHLWLAPLACFVATMAGDLLAACLVSIGYAQIELCIPLALAFSSPALLVAIVLRRRSRTVT